MQAIIFGEGQDQLWTKSCIRQQQLYTILEIQVKALDTKPRFPTLDSFACDQRDNGPRNMNCGDLQGIEHLESLVQVQVFADALSSKLDEVLQSLPLEFPILSQHALQVEHFK